jgi:hypothetical protein
MSFLRLPRISEHCVSEQSQQDMVIQCFTELSQILWLKVEILQMKMVLEVNQSMVKNSLIKISLKLMINHSYSRWLMQVKILMVLNSLLLLHLVLGWIANMLFFEKLFKDKKLLKLLRNKLPRKMETPKYLLGLPAQELSNESIDIVQSTESLNIF